jgi:Flp pilus assembly protein TadB
MVSKKNITIRVPPDTYDEFEEYRRERLPDTDEEISKADAGRRLLEAGLEDHRTATDGGQVLDELEQLRTEQQRATTTEKIENALIGVGLLVVAALAGGLGGPLVWVVAAVVATALIVLPFLPTVVFDS